LSESDYRGVVKLVCMSSEFEDQGKSNDQAYDDVTFVDFHFCFSFKTVLVFPVASKKELHSCFCCFASVLCRDLPGFVSVLTCVVNRMADNIRSELRGRHAESNGDESKKPFHFSSFVFPRAWRLLPRRSECLRSETTPPRISVALALLLRHGRYQTRQRKICQ
jgi:hypothetical protein